MLADGFIQGVSACVENEHMRLFLLREPRRHDGVGYVRHPGFYVADIFPSVAWVCWRAAL